MTDDLFRAKTPGIMRQLMTDFDLIPLDAGAILGNIGHECAGFTLMQEQGVKTKGGYGWAQWTGPRRRAYEAYCKRTGKDPASDAANYAYLFVELTSTEASAIPAVKAAATLQSKVIAFETHFERAGVKHYASRLRYANVALEAFAATAPAKPVPYPPLPKPAPIPSTPPASSLTGWAALIDMLLTLILKIFGKSPK